jgi:TonB family protein
MTIVTFCLTLISLLVPSLAAAVAQSSGSAAASDGPVATVNGWSIYDNRGRCNAMTFYEGGTDVSLSFDFGSNSAFLYLFNAAWESVENGRRYTVSITFSNDSEYTNAPASGMRNDDERGRLTGLQIHLQGDEFLDDFSESNAMLVEMGNNRLAVLSLNGTRAMVQRLKRCSIDSHRRYPPDPFRSIRSGQTVSDPSPVVPLTSYVSNDDYPAAALSRGEEGSVRFRLTVGPDGRVSTCTIVMSSGFSTLDDTTCRLMRTRPRFRPALDASGVPTTGSIESAVHWRIQPEPVTSSSADPATRANDGESVSASEPGMTRTAQHWVQLAGGIAESGLPREFARLRAKAPDLLGSRTAYSIPLRTTNRLLVGPFASAREAQDFVIQLARRDIQAFVWTSSAGQEVRAINDPR